MLDPFNAGVDQGLDFLRRFGRSPGEGSYLAGHHGKTASLLAGAGRFYGRVQGQDVGLEGNAVNHTDDVGDLARGIVNSLHRVDDLAYDGATLRRHLAGAKGQLVGLPGVVRV